MDADVLVVMPFEERHPAPPLRPSARVWLEQRDALLAQPDVCTELDSFFDHLRDPAAAPEGNWP